MDPLISVVITTYNLAWCIRETIEGVLAQTYPRTEIIVVDDASTDDTKAIVTSFGPRVTLIRNVGRTKDPAVNRNTGIQAASGEYIAFLDGDDLWEPEKLAVQVVAAQKHPTAGLIAVDGIQFRHEDGTMLKPSLYGNAIPWSSEEDIQVLNLFERALQGCCIDTPSQILVPRRVFDAVQGFTVDLPDRQGSGRGEDYDFLIKVAARYDFVMIRRKLVRYRYSASSLSALAQEQGLYFVLGDISILRRHLAVAIERHRVIIRDVLRERFVNACRKAVDESRSGRRIWSSWYLLALAKRYLTPVHACLVAVCLARVWRPNLLARVVRSVRSQGRTKTEA